MCDNLLNKKTNWEQGNIKQGARELNIKYLHGSPVIGKEGHCISKIPVVLGPHAITVILSFEATSYVITSYKLQIPKQRYL